MTTSDTTTPRTSDVSLSPELSKALRALDPENDDHWTNAGKPAMDAVNANLAEPVTRAEIDQMVPGFDRELARARIADEQKADDAPQPEPTIGGKDTDGVGDVPLDAGAETDLKLPLAFTPIFPTEDPIATRLAALEADLAFLRKQFGWPTKNT